MTFQGHDGKHLTFEMRRTILRMLKDGRTLEEIAAATGKDPRTISREIRMRRITSPNGRYRFNHGDCEEPGDVACRRLLRFPFVCDGCPKARFCAHEKHVDYDPEESQKEYKGLLSSARSGLDMSAGQYEGLDAAIKEGLAAKRSVYAITTSDPRAQIRSQRQVYRLIEEGKMESAKRIDLPRAVSFRPRRHAYEYKAKLRDPAVMEGRMIEDYWRLLASEPGILAAQMDTVIGSAASRKCLLTIHFPAFHLMLVRLLDCKSSAEVVRRVGEIREGLGNALFSRLFRAILSDRGPEFYDASGIEADPETGEALASLFYCDAYCSNQKGAIESNHRMLRYFFPKGTCFDLLTGEAVRDAESELASYPRKELGGRTPYDVFKAYYGEETLKKLGIEKADPRKIGLLMSGKKGKK